MNCIELIITAQAPLAIGRQKPGGSVSEAENYIPGIVIRGAIASQILRLAAPDNRDLSEQGGHFQALFLDANAAVFQNAYPAIAHINSHEWAFVPEPIRVLPATAVSSKNNGGFKGDSSEKGGVFDTLIDRYCAELCQHPYDPSCPNDGGRVEPFGGFYSCLTESGETHYRSHSVTTRFLTRVAINRRRATAQDEMLYSIEVLNESFLRDTRDRHLKWEYFAYRSHIWIEDLELAKTLTNFINKHQDTFRIGGGVSRGLGRVHLKATLNTPQNTVEHRIQQFNDNLKERWHLWSVMQPDPSIFPSDRTFFTIDLQSDAILTDRWQRTMVISPEILKSDGWEDDSLQLHTSYASYDYRAGWNAAWGLMKEMELITHRSSVFLLSTQHLDRWLPILSDLESRGIGDRTSEGFGQIRICDEFHTIFREKAV